MSHRRAAALALVLFAATACTSSGGAPTGPSSPAAPATTSSPTAGPTLEPLPTIASTTPSAPRTSVTPVSTSAPPTTPTPVASTTAAPRSTCTSVTTRVIRGSAAAGREFAALQFVNDGSVACELRGYPSVTLLLNGQVVGKMSTPSGSAVSARHLVPGDTAESQLNDYVLNCQAPLSDTVRVQVPGSDTVVERPGQLRACALRVGPLGAPE